MTKEIAESVKHLAKPVVEALEKVTESQCPKCGGYGGHYRVRKKKYSIGGGHEDCPTCSGTGKVKWKWEPEPGEWCIILGKLHLITEIDGKIVIKVVPEPPIYDRPLEKSDVIPILPWEIIEKVLEDVYDARFEFSRGKEIKWVCSVELHQNRFLKNGYYRTIVSSGKSCQEAVMLAVIGLGERLNENK